MQVLDSDNQLLGYCDVRNRQLVGKYFVVPLAEKGDYCEACKIFHPIFTPIKFDITIIDPWILALIARDSADAKYLPGFKQRENPLPKL